MSVVHVLHHQTAKPDPVRSHFATSSWPHLSVVRALRELFRGCRVESGFCRSVEDSLLIVRSANC